MGRGLTRRPLVKGRVQFSLAKNETNSAQQGRHVVTMRAVATSSVSIVWRHIDLYSRCSVTIYRLGVWQQEEGKPAASVFHAIRRIVSPLLSKDSLTWTI